MFRVPRDHPEIQRLEGRYKKCVMGEGLRGVCVCVRVAWWPCGGGRGARVCMWPSGGVEGAAACVCAFGRVVV